MLKRHLLRTTSMLLSVRLRNGGASQPLGEGDTPLREVLAAVASPSQVPLFVGYDYVGLRGATEEVRTSLAYLQRLSS